MQQTFEVSYKAHQWEDVLRSFRGWPTNFEPMVRLAERISLSSYRDLVFPVASMGRLLIFQTEDWNFDHEMLLIEYAPSRQMFKLEFFEHPSIKTHWQKACSVAEGYSAFVHFLKLKNWFPVTEIPKGY